ncbi:MAG: hypothetical protein AB1772_00755 [Candidatus Zixiibacteriota bacterium]
MSKYDFQVGSLDLSQLVGFHVRLFTKQFPGRELYARIVAAVGQKLVAEGGQRNDVIDNLVNNQTVVLQFPYRGETISVKARLQKSGGGQCAFDLDEKATPLSQRRFHRVSLTFKVNMASFAAAGVLTRKLDRLRWMETNLVNFSAGGALLSVPTILPDTVRLLVNIQPENFRFPTLIMAGVRHSYQYDDINCRAGIEFVTKENAQRMLSPYQMAEMPPVLFSYTANNRETLNHSIYEWDRLLSSTANTGANNEN